MLKVGSVSIVDSISSSPLSPLVIPGSVIVPCNRYSSFIVSTHLKLSSILPVMVFRRVAESRCVHSPVVAPDTNFSPVDSRASSRIGSSDAAVPTTMTSSKNVRSLQGISRFSTFQPKLSASARQESDVMLCAMSLETGTTTMTLPPIISIPMKPEVRNSSIYVRVCASR
jgi:hypothetical protein